MSSLCYPYGGGITCVCDGVGKIFKCFPDLADDEEKNKRNFGKNSEENASRRLKGLNFLDGQ